MEYLNIIISVITGLIGIIILVGVHVVKYKKISMKGGQVLGMRFDVEENITDKIQILSMPIAACKGDVLTPFLKLKVLDKTGKGIRKKKVRLEIYDDFGLMSINNISGNLVKYSDKFGCVEFNNICLKKSGRIQICIISDDIEQIIDSVDIFPPGLSIDYWNESIGTERYKEKLERVLNFTENKI